MNSRERFKKIFAGQLPDRVPITMFILDQGHFLSQIYSDLDPWDWENNQLKVIELQKQLELDVFVRISVCVDDMWHLYAGGVDITHQTDTWEVTTKDLREGNSLKKKTTIKTPGGELTQEISVHELRKGTYMVACTKKPINGPKDLDIAVKYEPKMPDYWPKKAKKRVSRIKTALGNAGVLGVWSPEPPFNTISMLIDHELVYSIFLTDFEYYEKLINFAIARNLPYLNAIDTAGIDVHCLGGNVAGGFIGKKFYDEYILSYEKRYIELAQQNGTPALYHNCGQIMELVESYKMLGVRIVEPSSPPPLGDGNLTKAKEMVKSDYIIAGGIDQVNALKDATVDEVRRKTQETLEAGKPSGGFILESADFIEYETPIENIETFIKTAKEKAWY